MKPSVDNPEAEAGSATVVSVRTTIKRGIRTIQERSRRAFRMATANLRPLPNVIVVGAMKCGTTTLFRELARSSSVRAPILKEVHFFDKSFERGDRYYRSWFRMNGGHVVMDCTPSYMFYPSIARKIYEWIPEAKIVAILRDPAERAWSHYVHNVARGRVPEGEAEFAACIENDIAAWSTRGFPSTRNPHDHYSSYARRGIYADQLEPYLDLFGENVFVMKVEAFYRDPQPELNRLAKFLGIVAPTASRRARNVGKSISWKGNLAELREFYGPHNERLYKLLGVAPWWPY